jgi:nucleoside-diphosphate-sugar epimerase
MENKKILILGGAGYIGGYTTDYLISKGYQVGVYDSLMYESRYLKDVPFIYGDIRDTDLVIKTAKEYDVVIMMAALVGDPACAVDITLTDEINHLAVLHICQRLDPSKHVIFLSTCSVYGSQLDILDETSPTNPLSSYALTKLQAERYVDERRGTIFRLGTVYGIGDTYSRIRLDLVVNVLAMRAVYDKKINIFGGEQWRPLICVKDIAGYIEESISKNIRGTYILSEGNYTMKILGEFMKDIFTDIELKLTDIAFEDARNYRVMTRKASSTFKYIPQYNIRTEVLKMKNIFEEHRICDVTEDTYHNGNFIKNYWIKKNMFNLD